ncbi:hypothetical protein [Nocardioides sp. AE5]|uniref:hypothetical protein n=1 Tax=Nocardioides sp. AE5 TaxID=2962573 RepID=UPI00288276C5|nr:hypothetical protein [Nocardioides sp. AE5]MDT0201879.1 hypothetical protein [Nocardioides sp. AE5]
MNLDLDVLAIAGVLAQHMGQLHAYEHLIVYALAFGPFIVLGIVVWFVRRRDLAEEAAEAAAAEPDDSVSSTHPRAT